MNSKKMTIGVATGLFACFVGAAASGLLSDEGLDSSAAKVLKDVGVTPSEVGGYSWTGCGQFNFFSTKFKGVNDQGRDVSGVVCETLFTGHKSVRFD
ncbi:MAG: hypothetical protein MRY79_08325 [Alphaproteobacteria bacterium]|nr:hypothetical protein [Alphaproteobacteria bacterium]